MIARLDAMAILVIGGAVAFVALLFVIGIRQRLRLEIPPRDRTPHPWPPGVRRAYLLLVGVGLAMLGGGAVALAAGIEWLGYGGIGLYLVTVFVRIGISFGRLRAERSRAAER